MDKKLFEELVQSLQQAQAIARGEELPSREFEFVPIDVLAHRLTLGWTQEELAGHLQVSASMLAMWEEHQCMREEYAEKLVSLRWILTRDLHRNLTPLNSSVGHLILCFLSSSLSVRLR